MSKVISLLDLARKGLKHADQSLVKAKRVVGVLEDVLPVIVSRMANGREKDPWAEETKASDKPKKSKKKDR